MEDIPKFTGFPKETLRFYEELKENNFRDWFTERKDYYHEVVLKPAQAFVIAFGEKLKKISSGFTYDTRTNGRGTILRIYRDIRFSKDKTPYSTHLRFRFSDESNERKTHVGFFIGLDETGGRLLGGIHKFPKEDLAAFRKAVADEKTGTRLVKAIDDLNTYRGFKVSGDHFKRVPREFDADHPRADLLKFNALHVRAPDIPVSILKKPELVDRCYEYAQKIAPVHHWLDNVVS